MSGLFKKSSQEVSSKDPMGIKKNIYKTRGRKSTRDWGLSDWMGEDSQDSQDIQDSQDSQDLMEVSDSPEISQSGISPIVVDSPSYPRVHDVYGALKTLLMSGDNDTLKAIQKMLPNQDITPSTGSLWIKLIELCNNPPSDDITQDPLMPDTLRLDDYEQSELGLQKRVASQLKWSIGKFNPQSEDTMFELLESGNSIFELFKRIMIEYSAVQSESMNVSEQGETMSCIVNPPPSQSLSGYEKILGPGTDAPNFPFPVYFDVETAKWIGELLRESVFNWGKTIKSLSERGVRFGINATVYVSSRTVKVGVLSLILLFNMAVKAAEEATGRAGQIMRYILETLFNQKELLFAGPFANITNPSDEETQSRRVKRFVMVYLYTMLKLLSVLKECNNIEWLKGNVIDRETGENVLIIEGTPLTEPEFLILTEFIRKEKSLWTVKEILNHGSRLFILILYNLKLYFRACTELSEDFVELYNNSLKFQFDLLNIRLGRADYDPNKLVTQETPIGNLVNVINNATDLRMVDADTLNVTNNLVKQAVEGVIESYGYHVARQKIEELFVPGGLLENKRGEWMTEVIEIFNRDIPLPEQEPASQETMPYSQELVDTASSSGDSVMSGLSGMGEMGEMGGGGKHKKRSKKRSKKKSKKHTKKKSKKRKSGKRKKFSKRKKTKRKSMKQVKEKLINLINSL